MKLYNNWKWIVAVIILIVLAAADRFVLGQFLMQILVLPIAIIGFFWTFHQIRKAQEVTDLHLYWSTGVNKKEEELPLKIPKSDITLPISLKLLNEGHLVAVWYLVEFRIPNEIARFAEIKFGGISAGEGENSRTTMRSEYWKKTQLVENEKTFTCFTFKSKGQEAAYPYCELELATVTVRLHGSQKYPLYCEVPYTIATDRGKPQKGKLILRFE